MNWVKAFGHIGKDEGEFLNSFELVISENPLRVYVSDWTNNNVQIFDGDGNYLQTLGGFGHGPGQLYAPRGMVVSGDMLYIADTGNRRIQRFRRGADGIYAFDRALTTGGPIPADAKLTHVALGTQLFVVDEQYECIYLFDHDFNYLTTYYGAPGSSFRNLRNFSVVPKTAGMWSNCQAVAVETDRIQMFRIGMDMVKVSASPDVFYPPVPEVSTTKLRYTQTENGLVMVYVYDSNDKLVRALQEQQFQGIGPHEVVWDGKDDQGNVLPGGTYHFTLVACDRNTVEGHAVQWVYKYIPVVIHAAPIVALTQVPAAQLSRTMPAIAYTLSCAGALKAQVIDATGAVTATLADGLNQDAGAHTLAWNGLTSGGAVPPDGYYTLRMQAKDAEGYWGPVKTAHLALANAPPHPLLTPPPGSIFGLAAQVSGSVQGFLLSAYRLEYSPDASTWTPIVQTAVDSTANSTPSISGSLSAWQTKNLPASETNSYYLRLSAANLAGATASDTLHVLVDNIPPRLPVLTASPDYISPVPAATGSTQNASMIAYQVVDGNTPTASLEIMDQFGQVRCEFVLADVVNGSAIWEGLDAQGQVPPDGSLTIRLKASDRAGNASSRDVSLTIDTNRYPEHIAVASTIQLQPTAARGSYRMGWSADGQTLYYTVEDINLPSNIWKKNADGSGAAVQVTNYSLLQSVYHPDLSPDGAQMVMDNTGSVQVRDMASGSTQTLADPPGYAGYARWSPDGTKIAYYDGDGISNSYINVVNRDGSGAKRLARGVSLSWSADSRLIYFSSSDGICSITYDGVTRTVLTPGWGGLSAEYSPDGNILTYRNDGGDVAALLRDGSRQILIPHGNVSNPGLDWKSATWSPDGNFMACVDGNSYLFVSRLDRPDRYANLTALLTQPTGGAVEIHGSAADLNFAGYELSYSADGVNWISLRKSTVEIRDQTLGDWNTTGLNGTYWLQLCVWDKALNRKEIRRRVQIGVMGTNLIANVSADPGVIFPAAASQNTSTIRYTVFGALTSGITLGIYTEPGVLVRALSPAEVTPPYPKAYTCVWDGKNNAGVAVAEGRYVFKLQAQGGGVTIIKDGVIVVADSQPEATINSPAGNVWVCNPVMIRGTAAGAGFSHYWLEVGAGSTPEDWALISDGDASVADSILGTWNALTDGVYSLRLRAVNTLGVEQSAQTVVQVDNTAPETTLQIQPHAYEANNRQYINPTTQITFSGRDGGVGCKEFMLRLDGQPLAWVSPLTITTPGEHVLEYSAVDLLGNQEPMQSCLITVHAATPATTLAWVGPQYTAGNMFFVSGRTAMTLSAHESGGGDLSLMTYWSAQAPGPKQRKTLYNGPLNMNLFGNGDRQIYFTSEDAAGNTESWQASAQFQVDMIAPETTLSIQGNTPAADGNGVRYATSATGYLLNAVDLGSQWEHSEYRILKENAAVPAGWSGYQPGELIILTTEGQNEIQFRSWDHVGNSETARGYAVTLDNTPPRISLNVQNGRTYVVPFMPVITIAESNLKTKRVLLDQADYTEGTSIASPGPHSLEIQAGDWAGNSAQAKVDFMLAIATATPTMTPSATVPPTPSATPTVTPSPTAADTATPTPRVYPVESGRVIACPNPARQQVQFIVPMEASGRICIEIYNLLGEKVAELGAYEQATSNGVSLVWNCAAAAPAVYFCKTYIYTEGRRVQIGKILKVAVIR